MYVCIYIYMHTYIYIYMYICIRTYICIHTYTCTYVYIYIYVHTRTHTQINIHRLIYLSIYLSVYLSIYRSNHMCAYYTYFHVSALFCVYTNIHIIYKNLFVYRTLWYPGFSICKICFLSKSSTPCVVTEDTKLSARNSSFVYMYLCDTHEHVYKTKKMMPQTSNAARNARENSVTRCYSEHDLFCVYVAMYMYIQNNDAMKQPRRKKYSKETCRINHKFACMHVYKNTNNASKQ